MVRYVERRWAIREARARVGMEGGFCGWLVGVLGVWAWE